MLSLPSISHEEPVTIRAEHEAPERKFVAVELRQFDFILYAAQVHGALGIGERIAFITTVESAKEAALGPGFPLLEDAQIGQCHAGDCFIAQIQRRTYFGGLL